MCDYRILYLFKTILKRPLFVPKSISSTGKCSLFYLKQSVLVQTLLLFYKTSYPRLITTVSECNLVVSLKIKVSMNKQTNPQKTKTESTILCGLLTHQEEKNVCAIQHSSMAQRETAYIFQNGDIIALNLGRCSLSRCDFITKWIKLLERSIFNLHVERFIIFEG